MSKVRARSINTKPLQFEEFATSMASLAGYMQDGESGFDFALDRLDQLFTKARKQPLGYRDVTDLTDQSQNSIDERAGRAAWLLQHTFGLKVFGVHSLVCHNVGGRLQAPLIQQLAIALNTSARLSTERLQSIGRVDEWLDVVGIKDGTICLIKVISDKCMIDSATKHSSLSHGAFRSRVFADRVLDEDSVATIRTARDLVYEAFPSHEVSSLVLVTHPDLPDFELYQLNLNSDVNPMTIGDAEVVRNSIEFADKIAEAHDLLLSFAERHDGDSLFRGIPPCRGGRSLNILAAVSQAQLKSESLLEFRQKDIAELLEQNFGFDITRDKIRHDLEDRLAGQGLMRKWGNIYFLTIRGMARYFYFLSKYSSTTVGDAISVVDTCSEQRNRIVNRFGYVV